MNNVDKNFYNLTRKISLMTIEDVFYNIKNSFLGINQATRDSIESFFNKFNYWGSLDSKNNNYDALYKKASTLKEHLDDFIWLYKTLSDYKSKKLLYGILNNWYSYDFNTIKPCLGTPYNHYFDLDIIPYCKDEVLVDLGAYTGDTIIDYINTYGKDSYRKIYCYDITCDTFAKLKDNLSKYENIEYKKKAVSDKIEELYLDENTSSSSANKVNDKGNIKLDVTTLDVDIKEEISMIKMDIEGSEEKALLGSINHIKNDYPKLLISVYHDNDHLWKIPKLISEINDSYDFYLRCYGNNIYPTEIVLFAIPKGKK